MLVERPGRPWPRFAAGLAIWAGLATLAAALAAARGDEVSGPAGKLARYAFTREKRLQATLRTPTSIEVGDPLLDARDRRGLGRVVSAVVREGVSGVGTATFEVELALDPDADAARVARAPLRACAASGDARWALETLLPASKRECLRGELDRFLQENGSLVGDVIRPLADEVLAHGMSVLEQNLAAALKKREPEIKRLLEKQRGAIKTDLLPVLKEQLGPSAKQKVKPILTKIGRELWEELPMWSISWRVLVDSLPGKRKSLIDEWWTTFLEEKAIPIVKAHEDELVRYAEELVEEGARDAKVREALALQTRRLAADPEFRAVVRGVFEDAVVKPFDPRELARKLAENPEHRARLDALEKAFAPYLRRMVEVVSVEQGTGRLDPDLARVLRRMVFKKDQRWIEADLEAAAPGEPR